MSVLQNIAQKYPEIVERACFAAISAGAKIMEVYSYDDFGVKIKNDDSPITLADRLADEDIKQILNSSFPDIPIISEEQHSYIKLHKDDIYFLVDPLDGTKEFIKKTDEFTVNIAVILNATAQLGVVYVPATGELYYRDLDGFSYLEVDVKLGKVRGKKTQISCRCVNTENLTVVKSVSHLNLETEVYIAQYSPQHSKSAGSSLKFGLIARGVADLYPRLGRTMEWDTGAAHAVLKGAGGNVFRLDTLRELSYGKFDLENPFFVASSNNMVLIPYVDGLRENAH